MRDIMFVIAFVLLLIAAFYAFQIIVALIVGYVVWLALPLIRNLSESIRS